MFQETPPVIPEEILQRTLFELVERQEPVNHIAAWLQHNGNQDRINEIRGWKTALNVACDNGYTDIAGYLLDNGAITGDASMNMHWICMMGHHSIVNMMLDRGYEIDSANEQGSTCLHAVSLLGRTPVVRILLDRGASIDLHDNTGKTPLHLAAEKGKVSTVTLLLERGAEVSAINNQNNTPLHAACMAGAMAIARQLIQHGAEIDAQNTEGRTPLDLLLGEAYKNELRNEYARTHLHTTLDNGLGM